MLLHDAYIAGRHAALEKLGMNGSDFGWQLPTTTPEGRPDMIDQAARANAAIGEHGQSEGGQPANLNAVLHGGGPPPAGPAMPRHFHFPTDFAGDGLQTDVEDHA
jgi:hypothetical protein